MRFSIITPSYNSGLYLEESIKSVLGQRHPDLELEYIIVDGNSTDSSREILARYEHDISHIVVEEDTGPANAINKGLSLASGDVIAWLNADDLYFPGTLLRVQGALADSPGSSFCFGSCPIVDEQGREIRSAITGFKELFFPLSCSFTHQCINYLSQPALFFTRRAVDRAGMLREDMVAAWDYEYILRLWHSGPAIRLHGSPLAAFRWHEGSISGCNFRIQFKEEYEAAKADAGLFSLQTAIHFLVRWGIVGIYAIMAGRRSSR